MLEDLASTAATAADSLPDQLACLGVDNVDGIAFGVVGARAIVATSAEDLNWLL